MLSRETNVGAGWITHRCLGSNARNREWSLGGVRWNVERNAKKLVFLFFSPSFSLPDEEHTPDDELHTHTHTHTHPHTVGCSDLLIPVLFHDQDQRDPFYNDMVNDNIATLCV